MNPLPRRPGSPETLLAALLFFTIGGMAIHKAFGGPGTWTYLVLLVVLAFQSVPKVE
jgi:hypothetical protein